MNITETIIYVILYLIVIVLLPIILDIVFSITLRKDYKEGIITKMRVLAKNSNKPLIIFYDRYYGYKEDPITNEKIEFQGDMVDILHDLKDNSSVILIIESLEYVPSEQIDDIYTQLERVTNGDYYIINIDKGSPRVFYDSKILHLSHQKDGKKLSYDKVNKFIKFTQRFYGIIYTFINKYAKIDVRDFFTKNQPVL
jgi:hypothetical protein